MLQYERNFNNVTPYTFKAYINTLSMAFRFILMDEYGFGTPYTGTQRRIREELFSRHTGMDERFEAACLRTAASLLADKYGFASLRRSMRSESGDWYEPCANASLLLRKGSCSGDTANKIFRAAREAAAKMIMNFPEENELLYTERMLRKAASEILYADIDKILFAWTLLLADMADNHASSDSEQAYNSLSPAMRCAFRVFASQTRR